MDGLRFYNYFLKVTYKVPKQKHVGKCSKMLLQNSVH